MGKKKHKGGGMSDTRKLGKQVIGGIRVLVLGTTLGHGAISAGQEAAQTKNFADFPRVMVFKYSGVDWNQGTWNSGQAANSALTIASGLVIAKMLSYASKHI